MKRDSKREVPASLLSITAGDTLAGAGSKRLSEAAHQALLPRYDLDIVLAPESHRMEVSETVTLPAGTRPRDIPLQGKGRRFEPVN